MKSYATVVRTLGFVCFGLAAASAYAVSPRAYVSVNGSDLNTCNLPSTPCRTFTGAITQVTSGGEVVVLDSGTFGGGTISQAVTINAPAGVAALAATAIIVNAGASDVVTLRGITFVSPTSGAGTALTFSGGAGLNVENCVFHGWQYGIYFGSAGKLNVADTTLRDGAEGIRLSTASGAIQAELVRVRLLRNDGYGLRLLTGAKAAIKDSVVSGNGDGLYTAAVGAELNVENCLLTYNNSAVYTVAGTIRISSSTVTNNTVGLFSGGGTMLSRGNSMVEGNSTDTSGTIGALTGK